MAFPYKKFFNYGENGSASIDWKTARVYEKIDGSLLTLYFAMGEWHVASSSLPDASGKISGLLNAKERKVGQFSTIENSRKIPLPLQMYFGCYGNKRTIDFLMRKLDATCSN